MTEKQITRFSFVYLGVRECTFIKSLLSVYKNRAKSRWIQQEESLSSDVIFLGTSLEGDASYEKLDIQPWQFVIFYGPSEIKLDFLHLYRVGLDEFAGNILEAIEKCERFLVGNDPRQNADAILKKQHLNAVLGLAEGAENPTAQIERFKLVRWPSASLMQKNRGYAVLAALLINREMTFDELVRRSGESTELCSEFLGRVRERGDVNISVATEATPQGNNIENAEKLGLFDRIRHRLGLRRRTK